jgi:quercetin dioxygenase-like cupin family protein
MIYVLQGALRALVDDEELTVREGEVLQVPGGAPHQAEALDDTFVLDVRQTESEEEASLS